MKYNVTINSKKITASKLDEKQQIVHTFQKFGILESFSPFSIKMN
jgi:hypothetical protein